MATLVVYSSWWAWNGGWLRGPRFFQFVYLALPLARAILAGSVALAGPYIKQCWDMWRLGVSR